MGSTSRSYRRPYTVALAFLAIPLILGDASYEPSEIPIASVRFEPTPSAVYLRVSALLDARHQRLSAEEVAVLAQVIVVEALAAKLQPELVAAVIHVESSGNRFAVSTVGAMGLMQLRPTTAESVAVRAGVAWNGPETLFDPVSNVRLGVKYLAELVDRFGDLPTALTAYNWGPTRIARQIRAGAELPVRYSDAVLRVYESLI
jgi:soluble lytic murein transglycosylase-like protein